MSSTNRERATLPPSLRSTRYDHAASLLISALILFGVDRLELFVDPLVGVKRTILVAFPACFAATVIDGLS